MKVIFEVDNTRIDYVRDDQLEKNLCFHLIAMEIPLVVNENELQLGGRRQIIIRKLPRMFVMVPKLSTRIFFIQGNVRRRWMYVGQIAGREVSEPHIMTFLKDVDCSYQILVKNLHTNSQYTPPIRGIIK